MLHSWSGPQWSCWVFFWIEQSLCLLRGTYYLMQCLLFLSPQQTWKKKTSGNFTGKSKISMPINTISIPTTYTIPPSCPKRQRSLRLRLGSDRLGGERRVGLAAVHAAEPLKAMMGRLVSLEVLILVAFSFCLRKRNWMNYALLRFFVCSTVFFLGVWCWTCKMGVSVVISTCIHFFGSTNDQKDMKVSVNLTPFTCGIRSC